MSFTGQWIDAENHLLLIHTPGHTPDSICVILEDEVMFPGDTLLPDITPHPSMGINFELNRCILPEDFRKENHIYGLLAYMKSLNTIATLSNKKNMMALPAHRLYYNDQFHFINEPIQRAHEIIRFHQERCQSILDILSGGAATIEEVAKQHFPPSALKGVGITMARNEIYAHVEMLEQFGDISWVEEGEKLVRPTGTAHFNELLGSFLHL